MTEAWLLHDEAAIRAAAGRPAGRVELGLPSVRRLDAVRDPKRVLEDALRAAAELTGRRARSFSFGKARRRVAESVTDWSALRVLDAFAQLERDTRAALAALTR